MSRKLCLAGLMCLFLFVFAACGNRSDKPNNLNTYLIIEGVSLVCNMDDLAESEEYVSLVIGNQSIGELVDRMCSQDYSMPESAYLIKLSDDTLIQAIFNFSADFKISEEIMDKLKFKINGSVIGNMISSGYGSEMLAASALTTCGKSYIQPDGWQYDNIILLLEYPGEYSSMVSYTQSGDKVISATSIFIKNGDKDLLTLLGTLCGVEKLEYDHFSGDQLQDLLSK